MVCSIKKGKSFERDVAHLLTDKTSVAWMRVPCSGAFSTSFNVQNNCFKGDVFTEDEKYSKIVVECKSYQSFTLHDVFSQKSNLYKWIEQCITESKDEALNYNWVLFVKANNRGIYMIYPNSYNVDEGYEDLLKMFNMEPQVEVCFYDTIDGMKSNRNYKILKIK